ncbi:hypothetical protein [Roseomonas indoligenes]|uniref:Uncharacterized protein n=1 Tax=Roseomonas indoligenes TaxID=2820811 RepID=A0A940MVR5_9PROT|nr:hypothetical protein [Pararoseomonas indoligenes]MBP0492593.1 hypothetical protein [Pararoseomonas indoligenes]
MATKWDSMLERAAQSRGTVAILCGEGDKEEVAAAARAVGARHGLTPQIDRQPADGVRVGYRDESSVEDSPLV